MPVDDHKVLSNAVPSPGSHAGNVQRRQELVVDMQDKVQVVHRLETAERLILLLGTDRIYDEAAPQCIGESGRIPIRWIEPCHKLQEIQSDIELHRSPVLINLRLV